MDKFIGKHVILGDKTPDIRTTEGIKLRKEESLREGIEFTVDAV